MSTDTVTTTFVECVSCGVYEELDKSDYPGISEVEANRIASRRGWTVRGYRGAKRTRCPRCRAAKRTDTQAAREGRIGHRAGYRGGYRQRHP